MSNIKAQIIKLTGGNYYAYDANEQLLKCRARGLFRYQNIKPVVGDYVDIQIQDHNEGYIVKVYERNNLLIRPAIANIDQAFIITSYLEPKYAFNLLNKFLAIVEHYQIKPIIVVTKIDLANNLDEVIEAFADYEKCGYQLVYTSIKDNTNLTLIKELIAHKTSVLVGQTGAGKSSLLNLIDPELALKTNEISKALNRGKHTTRHVEIFQVANGMIADSPGFSSLDLDMLSPIELAHSYHDFNEASNLCKFNNCLHLSEPGCHVKELVSENIIPQTRYDDYLKFMNEIQNRKELY